MISMRRCPAILLLLLFGFALIAPAVPRNAESSLPACCRKGGRHHCEMGAQEMGAPATSGRTFAAARIKCPFFPNGGAVLPHGDAVAFSGFGQGFAGLAAARIMAPDATHIASVFFHRAYPKRGPPALV